MAAGSSAVLTSFLINLVVSIACLFFFAFYRIQAFSRRFYAPRR